ncbi:hypothetical protein C8J56DRAFT_1064588 [Mycena floridula]|nr:hypothetical protein C8J56DRAFT_1064588 [Mycena floridula]
MNHIATESSSETDDFWINRISLVDKILERSVKAEVAPLPSGWTTWDHAQDLNAIFDRCELQIYLGKKYQFSFEYVELLMFQRTSDKLVFRYTEYYYRYGMEDAKLFIYPAIDLSVDDFLQRWKEDEKGLFVEPIGTDAQSLHVIRVQSDLVKEWIAQENPFK